MNPSIYPSVIKADTWDRIMEHEFSPASGNDIQYFPAVGKAVKLKIQCKAAGLTGAELKMCKAKMLTVCGRKPVCPPLFGRKKCKAKQDAWFKCTQSLFIETEKQVKAVAGEAASTDSGAGAGVAEEPAASTGGGLKEAEGFNWMPYAIGGGVLILAVGAYFIMKKGKAGKMQTIPIK
jgi:hypothetical protein